MLATRTSSVGAATVWLLVEVMAIVLRVGRVRGRWLGFDFATKAVRVSAFRFRAQNPVTPHLLITRLPWTRRWTTAEIGGMLSPLVAVRGQLVSSCLGKLAWLV